MIFTQIFISQIFECASLIITLIATLTFILQFSFEDEDSENAPLRMIESFTIIYFTFEYVLRFSCSPNKWRFFKHPMNLVDLFAILPFYLTFALDQLEDLQILAKAGKTIRLVRVLRIIRIFKLVRHFSGLQSLIQTLSDAYKELGLLMMIVFISILSFSVLIFYAEKTDSREDLTDKRNGKIKNRAIANPNLRVTNKVATVLICPSEEYNSATFNAFLSQMKVQPHIIVTKNKASVAFCFTLRPDQA